MKRSRVERTQRECCENNQSDENNNNLRLTLMFVFIWIMVCLSCARENIQVKHWIGTCSFLCSIH